MIEDYFVPGIEVERYVEGTDELGNPIKQWQSHLSISGVIDGISGDEKNIGDALRVAATHVLICPVVDIIERDRVKFRGITYEVKWVDNPMGMNRHLEVLLEVLS